MKKLNKKKIKSLAKESLEKKWYKIRDGVYGVSFSDTCSFCIDANGCNYCYIDTIIPNFCLELIDNTTEDTIKVLEQLAKYGELKK